ECLVAGITKLSQDPLPVGPQRPLVPAASRVGMDGVELVAQILQTGGTNPKTFTKRRERGTPGGTRETTQKLRVKPAHGVGDDDRFDFEQFAGRAHGHDLMDEGRHESKVAL